MKKSVLYAGIGYTLVGVSLFVIALLTEFSFESMLWGFGGAGVGPGIAMIFRYRYWSKPERQGQYAERLKLEKIELGDERKVMLRDKSGRITYLIMFVVYTALAIIFSVMTSLNYAMPFAKYATIGLSTLLIFQYVCGLVVFHHLSKKL